MVIAVDQTFWNLIPLIISICFPQELCAMACKIESSNMSQLHELRARASPSPSQILDILVGKFSGKVILTSKF